MANLKEKLAVKEEPAYVMYKKGITINTGNFESERYELSVTLPCDPGEVDATIAGLRKRVDTQLDEYEAEVKGNKTSKKSLDDLIV